MTKYNLQPNEAVVLKTERIQRGQGLLSAFTDELVLTNIHLIWVNKGMMGNVKRSEHLPLAMIKTFDGRAQAMLGKASNGTPQLEVFFQNKQEVFKFQSGGKREIGRWVEAINRVVTGNEGETATTPARALPGTAIVAETLRDTFTQFRGSFGGGVKAANSAPQRVKVSATCGGCGASVSGWRGSAAKCTYCDSESMLF